MVAPIFTGEAEKEVARRYAEGKSFCRVAKDYGCNYQAVKNACSRQGVEFRESPTARKRSGGQIEEVVRLYKETDVSTNELARRFGIWDGNIGLLLRRQGEPRHKPEQSVPIRGRRGGVPGVFTTVPVYALAKASIEMISTRTCTSTETDRRARDSEGADPFRCQPSTSW